MKACDPDICGKLKNAQQHAACMALLTGKSQEDAYASVYKARGASARSKASRLFAEPEIKAVIAHHQDNAAARAEISRADSLVRLKVKASATLADFVKVQEIDVGPERLHEIADIEDPKERAKAVKRLQSVELINWDDIDRDLLAAVEEISQSSDGSIKMKLSPRIPAENALAQLEGWREPEEWKDVTDPVKLLAQLTGVSEDEIEGEE